MITLLFAQFFFFGSLVSSPFQCCPLQSLKRTVQIVSFSEKNLLVNVSSIFYCKKCRQMLFSLHFSCPPPLSKEKKYFCLPQLTFDTDLFFDFAIYPRQKIIHFQYLLEDGVTYFFLWLICGIKQ